MLCRDVIVLSGVLVLLAGCSGGENPAPPSVPLNNSALQSGAMYVFTGVNGTLTQQAYVKASNTGASDGFGNRVAVDGDTLVVGAMGEDGGDNGRETNSGAVYVFVRSNNVWTQQAYLKGEDTAAGDGFGGSLALSGDTLVVGAPLKDSNTGAVYVFTRTNGAWTQQAHLKASNAEIIDGFGGGVALSGNTLAVGAPFEASAATGVNGNQANNSAPGSGAVYVFTRTNGVWAQEAYLKASNPAMNDGFGGPIALENNTLVVGASGQDTDGTNSGAVYVFTHNGTIWGQQAYLKALNPKVAASFGASVALREDTLAVGAPALPNVANPFGDSGEVHLFTRSGTAWVEQAHIIKASNAEINDTFGRSVALVGDTLAVGAPGEDSSAKGVNNNDQGNGADASGAVYVFTHSNGVWTQRDYVKASNTGAGDGFGRVVALAADALVIGAPGEGSTATGIVNGN